jgi:transcriptional regulator with XRE-family HTH domain
MEIDMSDNDDFLGPSTAGKAKGKKTREQTAKEQKSSKEAERREHVIRMMKEQGFPISDDDIIDYMDSYYSSLELVQENVGRPTKYFPELGEWAEWLGSKGYSLKQICAIFGVSHETLYTWAREYPEFSESLARARELAQSWWETIGQAALFNKSFNTFVWNKIISTRFRKDYTDRKGTPYDPNEPETIVETGDVLQLDPRDLTEEQKKVLRIAIAKAEQKEST